MTTISAIPTKKIQDFGQKIGGAKKDLAQAFAEKAALITNETLATQPLSKILPRPDFVKLFSEGIISEDMAIKLRYLYESIPSKPRTRGIQRWINNTMVTIEAIRIGLCGEEFPSDNPIFTKEEFTNFEKMMKTAGYPNEEFNLYPFRIIYPQYWHMTQEYIVAKGKLIQFRHKEIEPCIDWIKENTGAGATKKPSRQKFSIRQYAVSKECFITPEGKSRIVLVKGLTEEEAVDWKYNRHNELVEMYDKLRNIPEERNDWNRPRVGENYRNGKDISPETFASVFPFRGVEFGNWVNQLERAACLNEAYDAFCDLAFVLGVDRSEISLDYNLAMAFGARGSGKANAHYETDKKVINLTKTKGAGSLAHEWFHALDNHLSQISGHTLLYASCSPDNLKQNTVIEAFKTLKRAINSSDYYNRSAKIDEYKTKKYWATTVELFARAFEVYVVEKLAENGHHNDYLANIKTIEDYGRDETYPYPTKSENKVFAPLFDKLLATIYKTQLQEAV